MISRFNSITQSNNQIHSKKYQNNSHSTPAFKGPVDLAFQGGTQLLNSLNTNPAVGACFIDFFSMVLPRTLTDFSRGKDAGMETGIRESSGTVNHALAGIVGLGAGWLVSAAFNKANGVKTHFLFTDDKAFDVFSGFITSNKNGNSINEEKYFLDMFKNMKFFNTTTSEYKNSANGVKTAFTNMSDETAEAAAKLMASAKTDKYKTPKAIMQEVKRMIIGEKGAGEIVQLLDPKTGEVIEDTLENHLNHGFSIKQAFVDKIKKDIEKLTTKEKILSDVEFASKIKGLKKYTAAAGLAVPLAIGMSTQPINRYLTKKRTGSDGFVGVEGREPDKSTGFKVGKAVLGLALGSAMISTILKNPAELYKPNTFKKAIQEIGSSLQYKGLVPTINQFKFIYGMTIMSRLFAVRDKNEMRESTIKDTLGFANWLILGGFVSKIAAKLFNKDTLNYDKSLNTTGWKNKVKNSYIFKGVEKSHEEILYPALKKLGIAVLDENGNAVPFRKLISEMKKIAKSPEANKEIKNLVKETAGRLKVKNYQQMIGYVYSGLVLGLGIAKLNIAITNRIEGKNKKNTENSQKMKLASNTISQSLSPESKTFSAFGAYLN